ncbi:hypothetical protein JXR93_06680, partial [bacterium]|nr:hypothetical protein [bacterium]
MILSIILFFNLIERYFEIENSKKPEDVSEKISIIRELGYPEKADELQKNIEIQNGSIVENSTFNEKNPPKKNENSDENLENSQNKNSHKKDNQEFNNSKNSHDKESKHSHNHHEDSSFSHIESVVISEYISRNELSNVANLLTKALFDDKKFDDYYLFVYGVTLYNLNYKKEALDIFLSLEKKISEKSIQKLFSEAELYHYLLKLTPEKKEYYLNLLKNSFPNYLKYND